MKSRDTLIMKGSVTAIAAGLITSGTIFIVAGIFFKAFELYAGSPLESPGSYAVGMLFTVTFLPVLGLGSVIFTFFICKRQFNTLGRTVLVTTNSIVFALGPLIVSFCFQNLKDFALVYPATMLASVAGSVGLLSGAILQVLTGCWLLGWRGVCIKGGWKKLAKQ